jgi:DNA-binding transcriptional LysR family regulator
MDKLRAIKFFCRVVEAKSFAAAANDLAVVPSVLSKTISALEREVKFRLFNRTTRRVSLTENGALYYDRCKRLVVDLEEAEVLTRDGVARPAGKLLAGLHPAVNRVVMGRLDEFLSRYPDIRVEATLVSTASTLVEDKLDVLVTAGALPDSSYATQKLGTSGVVIVAAQNYVDRYGAPVVPEDLGRHLIVLSGRRDGPSYARWTLTRGNQKEIVFVSGRVVCREGVHMHEACLSGAGIARLMEISVRRQIKSGALRVLLPEWSMAPLPIHAVYPSRQNVPGRVRAFVGFVRAILKDRE